MTEGKVLAAARVQGLRSLTQVATALIEARADLFEGVAARSLAAKLSELNRENVTWWRGRMDRLEALEALLGLDAKELVAAEQSRRRGMWVCDEFPELPALDLHGEQPPVLAEPVALEEDRTYSSDLSTWLSICTGADHEQQPFSRLPSGVVWLHVPEGTGRSLLLARIQARNRIAVFEAGTLADAVLMASPLKPAVLAPQRATSVAELVALTGLDAQQPALVISAHPLPKASNKKSPSRQYLPNWEWLAASLAERKKSVFHLAGDGMHGGHFWTDPITEFTLTLVPTWRSQLLQWIDARFARLGGQANTLFSAGGLSKWLEAFDPDEALIPTPAALLSLARVCHEIGERKLPPADVPDAGLRLVKKLGRADSRYQSLLARLVVRRWVDASTPWRQAIPWDAWLPKRAMDRSPVDDQLGNSQRIKRRTASSTADALSQLTEGDLDAAAKAGLLVPDSDGNYGFRSHAEAVLILRDQLRGWMQSGHVESWGAQVVGDHERQRLADAVLATVGNKTLLHLCQAAAQLPCWSAASLGASETLFLSAGLRMAAETLSFGPELDELIRRNLAKWDDDDDHAPLPMSRSLLTDSDRNDWTLASWGWSLVAPKPRWVPATLAGEFPGWRLDDCDWLARLRVPSDTHSSPSAIQLRRLARAANTAAELSKFVAVADTHAPEALCSLVGLLRAAHGSDDVKPGWWPALSNSFWALEVLSSVSIEAGSKVQLRLASSLIEACSAANGASVSLVAVMHCRVWKLLLDGVDVRRMCDELTASGIAFLANYHQSVPQPLLRAIADRIEPARLSLGLDWKPLLGRAGIPSRQRIEQLLAADSNQHFGILAAVWSLKPEMCLDWAEEPENPYLDLLLLMCPKEQISELIQVLTHKACAGVAHELIRSWAKSRIAEVGDRSAELLGLLDLTGPADAPKSKGSVRNPQVH